MHFFSLRCVLYRLPFVSSLDKLSEETKLTKREIRTAIAHLKTTGELTVRTTNKYSVFTMMLGSKP